MKYIEFGIGNRWLIRTEIEYEDGSEIEERGMMGPINFRSFYIRIWMRRTVLILDSKDGFKKQRKNRSQVKLIVGITSY
ncbi:DUF3977 family protein [Bacillus salitolerans]|uniref:DUF3977 family protein n=1 Tax=Bacillus salitolerans TaxID=1437434 RepID=A0ABW4LU04_9BACI